MLLNQPKISKTEEVHLEPGKVRDQLIKLSDRHLDKILSQANNYADYIHYTALMNDIAEQMRETPSPKSDKPNPKDTNALLRVEFPDNGGVITWMENQSYPFKGYPHYEFVEKVDFVKKINRALFSGFYHQLKGQNKAKLLLLLPSLWILKDGVRTWIRTFYRFIDRFKIKNQRYCTFVRELHKTFTDAPSLKFTESQQDGEIRLMLRDLICMILEFDNAYRFRAQDIASEIDKQNLQKNPVKELLRLIDVLASREKTIEIKDTWKLIKLFVSLYLRFDRKMLKLIQGTLLDLNIENAKLSIEDKWYCIPREDYSFGFILNQDEECKKLLKLQILNDEFKKDAGKIQEESTKEHKEAVKNKKDVQYIIELDKKFGSQLEVVAEKYKKVRDGILSPVTT